MEKESLIRGSLSDDVRELVTGSCWRHTKSSRFEECGKRRKPEDEDGEKMRMANFTRANEMTDQSRVTFMRNR